MDENKSCVMLCVVISVAFLIFFGMISYSINTLIKAQGETSPQIYMERNENNVK